MPNNWLNVPHISQQHDGTCLEACVCMILAYLQSPVLEDDVCRLFGSELFGTPSSRIRRLSNWGYDVAYRSATLSEIEGWLNRKLAPIAFVNTEFLDYWTANTPHAVVIVGLEDGRIFLNDPAFAKAPQSCSLDGFLAAWAEMDEVIALVQQGTPF